LAGVAALLILAVTVIRLREARHAVWPGHADPAFFFGVAQNIRAGGGPNIDYVWHYLVPHAQLHHYAFDYWLPAPSYLMALGLLVGHGLPAALSVGILLVPVFAASIFLLTRELAGTAWAPALAAVLAAVAPGTTNLVLQPESAIYLSAFTGVAMAAAVYARRRPRLWILAGVASALATMSRSEGMLLSAAVLLVAIVWRTIIPRLRQVRYLLIGFLPLITVYVVVNLVHFSSPLPPASSAFPFIDNYQQLSAVQVPHTVHALLGGGTSSDFITQRWISLKGLWPTTERLATRNTSLLFILAVLLAAASRLGWFGRSRGRGFEEHTAAAPAAELDRAAAAPAADAEPHPLKAAWRAGWQSSAILPALFTVAVIAVDCLAAPVVSSAGATYKAGLTLVPLVVVLGLQFIAQARPYNLLGGLLAVCLVIPQLTILRPVARSTLNYDNAVGYNELRFIRQLRAEQACLRQPLVLMTPRPWEFTQATGIPSVMYPSGPQSDVLTIVGKYGVTDVYDPGARPGLQTATRQAADGYGPLAVSAQLPPPSFYRFRATTPGARC